MAHELILAGFYFLTLIYSVILHEVAHGYVALRLGDLTAKYAGRLTLNPVSHIDPFGSIILPGLLLFSTGFAFGWAKPVPYNPYNLKDQKWGPLYVALAGPGVNFLIALIAAIIAKILPLAFLSKQDIIGRFYGIIGGSGSFLDRFGLFAESMAGSLSGVLFGLLVLIVFWNVVLGCFNLLPIPPLDGSKILSALNIVSEETFLFLERYGIFILLAIILFFPGPISIFISTVLRLFLTLAL